MEFKLSATVKNYDNNRLSGTLLDHFLGFVVYGIQIVRNSLKLRKQSFMWNIT